MLHACPSGPRAIIKRCIKHASAPFHALGDQIVSTKAELGRTHAKSGYAKDIFILKQLVTKDFKLKYRRSFLGVAWSVLNPLLMMVVMSIVFSFLFNSGIENFPLYLIIGNITFSLMSDSTSAAPTLIIDAAPLQEGQGQPLRVPGPEGAVRARQLQLLADRRRPGHAVVPRHAHLAPAVAPGLPAAAHVLLHRHRPDHRLAVGLLPRHHPSVERHPDRVDLPHAHLLGLPDAVRPGRARMGHRPGAGYPMYSFLTFMRDIFLWQQSPEPAIIISCAVWAAIMLVIGIFVFRKTEHKFILYV